MAASIMPVADDVDRYTGRDVRKSRDADGLHRLDQVRDFGAPVPHHGPPHGVEQIRRDFGRAGQEEAAERDWRVHGGRWYRPRPHLANRVPEVRASFG